MLLFHQDSGWDLKGYITLRKCCLPWSCIVANTPKRAQLLRYSVNKSYHVDYTHLTAIPNIEMLIYCYIYTP